MTQSEQHIRDNLIRQLDSLKKHCNEKSYATRERYYDACCRFCDFLAKQFRSQKFANIQSKHITAYVEYLQGKGISPATIQSDLAGIRFYHRHAGGKNRLPENSELSLDRRSEGAVNPGMAAGGNRERLPDGNRYETGGRGACHSGRHRFWSADP